MNQLREQHRTIVNVKDEAIRVSMGFFNTEDEIERTVNTIAKLSHARGSVVVA